MENRSAVITGATRGIGKGIVRRLAASMSINVLERTREIGILRAVGMTDSKLFRMVMIEGCLIGAASWLVSMAISLPVSLYLGNTFTMIFFQTGIDFSPSAAGALLWGGIILIFAAMATRAPAKTAARLPVARAQEFE